MTSGLTGASISSGSSCGSSTSAILSTIIQFKEDKLVLDLWTESEGGSGAGRLLIDLRRRCKLLQAETGWLTAVETQPDTLPEVLEKANELKEHVEQPTLVANELLLLLVVATLRMLMAEI